MAYRQEWWKLPGSVFEALIALPEQLFYNTGIATYVWVLTNRKRPERRGKVQLIDASHFDQEAKQGLFSTLMRKTLGSKRREIPFDRKQDILRLLTEFEDGATRTVVEDGEERKVVVSRIYPTAHFGFRKITVDRPLRLDLQASPERISRLDDERAFCNLAVSRKRGAAMAKDEEAGRARQAAIRALLAGLPKKLYLDRAEFEAVLGKASTRAKLKLAAPIKKAILSALSDRNEGAEVCRDKDGHPEPDPELRDTECVPLEEVVEAFLEREVLPHVPDAWIDSTRRDPQDGEVGLVGYEINFNRYSYRGCLWAGPVGGLPPKNVGT